MRKAVSIVFFVLLSVSAYSGEETMSAELAIQIGDDGTWPTVTLETSVYRAVIRVNPGGGDFGNEHAIRDWVVKKSGRDQVEAFIDACAQRGPLKKAEIVSDTVDAKAVRLEYSDGAENIIAVSTLTIFRDSPVMRIDYEKYTPWTNTVDIGDPGAVGDGDTADKRLETRVYGQEEFRKLTGRGIVFHEESYWNTYDEPQKDTDPADAGPLAYKGHLIMAAADRETGEGFGRVMPVKTPGKGGAKILKLLWNRGFECFPATGDDDRAPYTGYIYVFTGGLDDAIEMGKRIVDGDMFVGGGGDATKRVE